MGYYNLSDMLDEIDNYRSISKNFGFAGEGFGAGRLPWSVKYVNPVSDEELNFRASDWTLFESTSSDSVIAKGKTSDEMKRFLLSRLSHEELLEYACQ